MAPELLRLIKQLSDRHAYPAAAAVDVVEVRQTHISVVFLAGRYVYKVKKPLTLDFLDYGTLERRRHCCEEEVRVNRRLAPAVYLDVVPITRDPTGVRVEGGGPGEVVEWAVKMARLPAEATLRERLRRGEVGTALVEALARRIAEFHAGAGAGPTVAASARFDVVAGNARENLAGSAQLVGQALNRRVYERLADRTEQALATLRPTIERRAARGVPRDGHGDLRLDHVYLFPEREPPADLVIVDAIEFNERFRHADPVADMAFLAMDLAFHGRRDLAHRFADAYEGASGDAGGRVLLPFYTSYRAAVRGRVEAMKGLEPEVSGPERDEALASARGLWLLALGALEEADRRPGLVLVGGLPGTGKSTLARGLAERAGLAWIRSDRVRKELAGLGGGQPATASFTAGIYTPEWTERTYAECLRRAEALLLDGRRVVVDASFRGESHRRLMLDLASRCGVPGLLLLCDADPSIVRARLESRRDDPSDAGWSTYLEAAAHWEEPGPATQALVRRIDASADPEAVLDLALEILRVEGLAAGDRRPGADERANPEDP
jgi:aminoglycoside phosphotransferase family enzyme/predicted kinase